VISQCSSMWGAVYFVADIEPSDDAKLRGFQRS
jgi:hypothetical protein